MNIDKDITLAPCTTFGIGGPADYFAIASSENDIIQAVTFAKEKQIPFFLLGTGANILVGDRGFRGLVIKNEAKKAVLEGGFLTAESGAAIEDLIAYTTERGLSGLEHFAGIPSSVGGALWQNLHFLSPDRSTTLFIADILQRAKILKEDGTIDHVDTSYFHFGYDYSILHDKHDVVLSATFHLTPEKREVIQEHARANLLWRQEKHPENATHISAGSVFKKIDGHGAGRLIEQVGLKGKQVGGAKISEKHANFIVNTGTATAMDVRALIDLVQQKVQQELGLRIQPEISFVGEF